MKSALLLGAVAAALCGTEGQAQQPASGSPQLATVFACRSRPSEAERLKCYDQAVDALAKATDKGQVFVVSREDVKRTRRSLFGFSIPKLSFFRGDTTQESEPSSIEARIKTVRPIGYNKWTVELEDGARWNTTEPDVRGAVPKDGSVVRIRKAALGGYFLAFDRSRPLRAMRVR